MEYTYGFLKVFHDLAGEHLAPAVREWITQSARGKAGGAAYPNNSLLSDDHVEEGVSDAGLYRKAYNSVVRLLGRDLAQGVAREVAGVAEVQVEDDLSVTEADLDGLTPEQEALFRWGLVHVQEIYGADKEPPDYVPKAKRKAWIAMFNAILKSTGDEGKAFAITNARFVEKK